MRIAKLANRNSLIYFLRRLNINIAIRAHKIPTIPPNIIAVDNLSLLSGSQLVSWIDVSATAPKSAPPTRPGGNLMTAAHRPLRRIGSHPLCMVRWQEFDLK